MTQQPRLPAAAFPTFDGSQPCARFSLTAFFPEPHSHPRVWAKAKAICFYCPFRAECLAYSLSHDVQGVWGGTTETDRRAIRVALGVRAHPAAVGDQAVMHERIDRLDNRTSPDTEIARQAGCSDRTVQRRRAAREAA